MEQNIWTEENQGISSCFRIFLHVTTFLRPNLQLEDFMDYIAISTTLQII